MFQQVAGGHTGGKAKEAGGDAGERKREREWVMFGKRVGATGVKFDAQRTAAAGGALGEVARRTCSRGGWR